MKLVAIGVLVACNHVHLDPPAPNLGVEQRVQFFRAHRPLATAGDYYLGLRGLEKDASILFADGTEIVHADDLVPLLPPDSPSALAATRSAAARTRKWEWIGGGLGAFFVGATWFMAVAIHDTNTGASDSFLLPLVVALAGGVIGAVGGFHYRAIESDERDLAFRSYEADLARRLAVCVDGLSVVACDSAISH